MNRTPVLIASAVALAVAAAALVGCASVSDPADPQAQVQAMMRASFRSEGIAKLGRIEQDFTQQACSADTAPPAQVLARVEAEAATTLRWPAGGQYLGDWHEGEKLAQSGRGMTWTDASDKPSANGASCYNCHQIDQKEIAFGTIGPSLWNYGKLRGVKDVTDPVSAAIVQYTWGKLWNSQAFVACSRMPRFGHMGLLDENQLRHLMALLLDPKSPVNE